MLEFCFFFFFLTPWILKGAGGTCRIQTFFPSSCFISSWAIIYRMLLARIKTCLGCCWQHSFWSKVFLRDSYGHFFKENSFLFSDLYPFPIIPPTPSTEVKRWGNSEPSALGFYSLKIHIWYHGWQTCHILWFGWELFLSVCSFICSFIHSFSYISLKELCTSSI